MFTLISLYTILNCSVKYNRQYCIVVVLFLSNATQRCSGEAYHIAMSMHWCRINGRLVCKPEAYYRGTDSQLKA